MSMTSGKSFRMVLLVKSMREARGNDPGWFEQALGHVCEGTEWSMIMLGA